jgi:iron-sulfur cluster assembly accessory protein
MMIFWNWSYLIVVSKTAFCVVIAMTLLVDSMSFQYLVGAEIDYKEDINGSQFVIKNPNATTTCGCGSSFSA